MKGGELLPLVVGVALIGFAAGRTQRPSLAAKRVALEIAAAPAVLQQGHTVATPATLTPDTARVRDDGLIRTQIREGARGTYIDAMLATDKHLITRWPDRRVNALRVWIERDPNVRGWNGTYYVAAARAFEEWREAGLPVTLDAVVDSSNTDIRIVWTDRFPTAAGDQIGVTTRRYDADGWIRAAEITIATHDRNGIALPSSVIFGVVRHEAGHALGLGHSPNAGDVMFPFSRATAISAADRATLHLLYRLPPGTVK